MIPSKLTSETIWASLLAPYVVPCHQGCDRISVGFSILANLRHIIRMTLIVYGYGFGDIARPDAIRDGTV